jgi:hypothetical protein
MIAVAPWDGRRGTWWWAFIIRRNPSTLPRSLLFARSEGCIRVVRLVFVGGVIWIFIVGNSSPTTATGDVSDGCAFFGWPSH